MKSTKHNYQLFEKQTQDDIKELMKKIRSEVQWLDQYCMKSIYHSEDLFDVSELVDLKERLEEMTEYLCQENHIVLESPGYSMYLLESDPEHLEHMRTRIEELASQS